MSKNVLKYLIPINELISDQWEKLEARSVTKSFPTGSVLHKDSFRNWFVYLLEGEISITNRLGHQHFLLAENDRFKTPLFDGPEGFVDVTTNSDISLVLFDRNYFELLKKSGELESEKLESISVDAVESDVFEKIFTAYSQGMIELPSLPDIAIKVRRAIENENVTIEDVSHIIEADPAIAVHILKVANSPLNRTANPLLTIRDAVMRLGLKSTRDYVLLFSIKNLFVTKSAQFKDLMKGFYQHSVRVAAVCMSISRLQHTLQPEHALLAGLLHDIGVIPILNYSNKMKQTEELVNELPDVIDKLKPLVGSMLLKQWGIEESFVCVAENAENWFRNESPELDYGDLVVIAQLQDFIRSQMTGEIPELEKVPAFKKITEISQEPDCRDKIRNLAHEELHEIMQLLT